ncbi:polysaccharide lyase family 7 protein [Microvirga arabica]|uniref:Polysaccharide lyase family 7 protein n=1 Tax=Microvirga arabica TaxID=1128671 RepID=A0ABV6YAE7_9HYPH|nr:polysaccharide lyase family 7 protein [Microvirga arabica]MBM1172466.1 polysaccharide lyase family 7 protein [Microvirga arabica]
MALNASSAPSGNFNLSNWKITLPVDQNGRLSGTAVEVQNLSDYKNSKYFYTGSDGAMVFYAPVNGATTKGSSYARSELREMNGSEKAAWNLSSGGFMSATLEVDAAPNRDGVGGRLVVGQIHGQDDELVRLYWENGTVYFVNDQAGSGNSETKFTLKDSTGATPDVSLNEKFSYTINAKGSTLDVDVYADGKVYESSTKINSVWQSDTFYFKAGAYLGANESNGSGAGQASFYALDVNHDGRVTTPTPTDAEPTPADSSPTPAPVDPIPEQSEEPTPTPDLVSPDLPTTTKTITGDSGGNSLRGTSGSDLIDGKGGDDTIWAKNGSDILSGGSGEDAFVFDTKSGNTNVDTILDFSPDEDTIRLNDSVFTMLEQGKLLSGNFVIGDAAKDSDDYIIYNDETGALSYDADGEGAGAAVQFGAIHNLAKLAASHFIVI